MNSQTKDQQLHAALKEIEDLKKINSDQKEVIDIHLKLIDKYEKDIESMKEQIGKMLIERYDENMKKYEQNEVSGKLFGGKSKEKEQEPVDREKYFKLLDELLAKSQELEKEKGENKALERAVTDLELDKTRLLHATDTLTKISREQKEKLEKLEQTNSGTNRAAEILINQREEARRQKNEMQNLFQLLTPRLMRLCAQEMEKDLIEKEFEGATPEQIQMIRNVVYKSLQKVVLWNEQDPKSWWRLQARYVVPEEQRYLYKIEAAKVEDVPVPGPEPKTAPKPAPEPESAPPNSKLRRRRPKKKKADASNKPSPVKPTPKPNKVKTDSVLHTTLESNLLARLDNL